MFQIIKQIKPGYSDALKNGDLEKLESYIKRLVKYYKETPKENREEFGAAILEILNMQNSRGETALVLDINDGNNGEIEEAIYSFALESKNLDMINKLIYGLVKAYEATKSTIYSNRKEYGKQSLEIFNSTNSKREAAVMIAAVRGRADLLKIWYKVPGKLTEDEYLQEEHNEIYAL